MRRLSFRFSVLFAVIFIAMSCWAQVPGTSTNATVPALIKVSGTLMNAQGTVGVTFALYAEQSGGRACSHQQFLSQWKLHAEFLRFQRCGWITSHHGG